MRLTISDNFFYNHLQKTAKTFVLPPLISPANDRNMKYFILTCLLIPGCLLNAQPDQNFAIETLFDILIDYPLEYKLCAGEISDLERTNPDMHGPARYYQADGSLFTGCAKQDAVDNRSVYIYYISNGYLEKLVNYYYNGQLHAEFLFKDGEAHGHHLMYYPDGKPYIREYYQNGAPVGLHERWHANGKIARQHFYNEEGKKEYDRFYNKEGELNNLNGC